jgi:hypothetical protein
MTYKIGGTEFTLQPTTGRWLPRDQLGIDGNGHPVYSPFHGFEIRWEVISPSQFNQIQNFFSAVNNTGTAVVDLPRYAFTSYSFFSYSGCVLSEPQMEEYFDQYHTNVVLLVSKIAV